MALPHAVHALLRPLGLCLLLACTRVRTPAADTLTLDVGAQRRRCVGEAVQQCLVVRQANDSTWRNLFDPIEGFTHEAGYRYRLLVERRGIERPQADASRYRYRLVRVLLRVREVGDAPTPGR